MMLAFIVLAIMSALLYFIEPEVLGILVPGAIMWR